jgi:hypothetical protein
MRMVRFLLLLHCTQCLRVQCIDSRVARLLRGEEFAVRRAKLNAA